MKITSKGKHALHLYSTSKIFEVVDSIEFLLWKNLKPIWRIFSRMTDFIWYRGVTNG